MIKDIEEMFSNLPKTLFIIMIALVLIHIGFLILNLGFGYDWVYGLSPLFNLDIEKNVPTLFSTIILLISSFLLFIIYKFSKTRNPDRYWAFLALIFLLLSLDEMIGFHELLVSPLRESMNLTGYFHYSWVIVGIIFVFIIALLSIPFLRRLPKKAALHFIIAGGIYITGAIGVEMLGGNVLYIYSLEGQVSDVHETSLLYQSITTVEETLEMVGIVFFIYILVRYLRYVGNDNDCY